MSDFIIREAVVADVPLILQLIKELAEYENMAGQVVATEEILADWIFNKQKAEVLIGEEDGQPVGFVLFFYNFSTFLGRSGLYIEDLYVRPHARKKGFGKAFFQHLARLCIKRGCGRLEWWCLDWNTPSIGFYLSMGAVAMSDWTVYRLSGDTLTDLANS